jgi:hypothetical protein
MVRRVVHTTNVSRPESEQNQTFMVFSPKYDDIHNVPGAQLIETVHSVYFYLHIRFFGCFCG